MAPVLRTRRATAADLDAVLADVQAGFDSYVQFAPAGWRPPDFQTDRARSLELLTEPSTWALIAVRGREPIGHVAFFPGRQRVADEPAGHWSERPLIPGLAHLWQLFVMPEHWGRGVGARLHDAATAEMRTRGYGRARLFTPSQHVRARKFYERRGWGAGGDEWNPELNLMLTEYELDLAR